MIENTLNGYLGPQISSFIKHDQKAELQDTINHVTYAKMALLTISSFLLIFFSKNLLGHFGPSYVAAEVPLIINIVASMLSGFFSASAVTMVYTGHEKSLMTFSLFQFFLLVFLGSIGLYFFGLLGIALAGAVSSLYKLIRCSYYMKKELGLYPW